MVTIVGLHSGKEFLVQDNAFALYQADKLVHIFLSVEGGRLITVKHDDIEYFDEPKTEKRIDQLNEFAAREIPTEGIGMEYA